MSAKCGVALLLVACFAGFFAVSSAQADRCEQGWSNYGDSCYFREAKNKKTWQKALSHCENMQADLVTVNNEDEMDFLKSIFGKFGSWCGLNNQDDKNNFVWQSGEHRDYTNWGQRQPMVNNKKRCVHMFRKQAHKWRTAKCSAKFRYTCEKDAGPPPSPCSSNPCKNGGTCIEEGDSYRCHCAGRFTGPQCETEKVVDLCDPDPCMNGGKCTSTGVQFSCACTGPFVGDSCETYSHSTSLDSAILGNLDKKYLEQLLSYLNPVLMDSVRSEFVRCYHAKTDGWASTTFHSNCDGQGPTVTIIQVNSYIFGGYTNKAWYSSCSYSAASKAFIYSLNNSRGYSPVKLTQYRRQHEAMFGCSSYGPVFGGSDIVIYNDANSNSRSRTNPGGIFQPPPGCIYGDSCSQSFLAGTFHFTPTDYEVFYETTS